MQAFYTQGGMVIQINTILPDGAMAVNSVMFGDPGWENAEALVASSEAIDIAVPDPSGAAALPYPTAQDARRAVVRWIDRLTAQVMDKYPLAVQKRWDIEEAAARAVKAGSASAAQLDLVTREGATKGRTPLDHADRIIANADNFRAIADEINTLFLSVDGQIEAALDPDEFEGIIAAAKVTAMALATSYGLAV